MTETNPTPLAKTLPAAVLKLWLDPPGLRKLERIDPRGSGLLRLDVDRWLFPVLPGDPAVFDRAARLGWRLLQALAAELGQGKVRALIAPTAMILGGNGTRLLPDVLLEDLDRVGQELPPDALHLTGHAARNLEGRWATATGPTLHLRSGRQVPTLLLGPGAPGLPPWRNPELLGRATRWLPIPEVANPLAELLVLPVARLTGPLGVGKTRLAWEVLRASQRTFLWRRGGGEPVEPEPSIDVWLQSDRSRPIWVIYDTLESADPGVWAEVLAVASRADIGKGVHLLLIGRSGTPWPPAFRESPILEVGALEGAAWDRFAQQVLHGLGLPMGVVESLLTLCCGNPFALEEALLQLVREHQLRQVLGSFFYAGREDPRTIGSSSRFRLHVEAELLRLGAAEPLRWLGLTSYAVPTSELAAATFELTGKGPDPEWDKRAIAAGVAELQVGPWGEGLRPAVSLMGSALVEALDAAGRQIAFETLGALLAARSCSGEELWAAWSLLQGTPSGARVALEAFRSSGESGPVEERFESLLRELQIVTHRNDDPELEQELVWVLVPAARKLGRLPLLREYLERVVEQTASPADRQLAFAVALAELDRKAGRLMEAERRLRLGLAQAQKVEDRKKQIALLELGSVLIQLGRRQEAEDLLARLLEIAQAGKQSPLAASCSFLLGSLYLRNHQLEKAEEHLLRALEIQRDTTGPASQIRTLCALGALEANRGHFSLALARYQEAEVLTQSLRNRSERTWVLMGKGRTLLRLGDTPSALQVLREALQLKEWERDEVGEGIARTYYAEGLLALGQLDAAHAEARKALFAVCLSGMVEAEAEAGRVLGEILLKLRKPREALSHFDHAAELAQGVGHHSLWLESLTGKLQAALALGEIPAIAEGYRILNEAREGLSPNYFTVAADYALFRAAERLCGEVEGFQPASDHLAAAYHELLREVAFQNDPAQRQRYLFHIPVHAAILDAARQAGLPGPAS